MKQVDTFEFSLLKSLLQMNSNSFVNKQKQKQTNKQINKNMYNED